MENEKIGAPLKEIIEEFKAYVENLITYNKLLFVKGASELSSYLILLVVLFGLSGFVLLFFSFAFAGWFSEITKLGPGSGHLVMAVFYILLGFIVFRFRKKLIFNPSRKIFGEILFGDFDTSDDGFKFEDEKTHSESIKKVQNELEEQKVSLNEKVKILERNLTISNIIQEIIGKAYDSLVTTSNIARFAFSIIRKLKMFSGKKKRKTKKPKTIKKSNKKD